MDKDLLYYEKQKFSKWWLWLTLFGINCSLIYGFYQDLVNATAHNREPLNSLMIALAIALAITALLMLSQLDTRIKKEGIYVRYSPFHLSYRFYSWEEIQKVYVRKYNPLLEYGGWGLRLGLFGKGNAYNVSGNMGLQLELTNHKKLLIGTNKPKELEKLLIRLEQEKIR